MPLIGDLFDKIGVAVELKANWSLVGFPARVAIDMKAHVYELQS